MIRQKNWEVNYLWPYYMPMNERSTSLNFSILVKLDGASIVGTNLSYNNIRLFLLSLDHPIV